ncbi:murein transglycosylase [Cladophialophora psammophila CBS 110553]|uniref:Murein transglycosylase n=1 Tax=Cladophialophora psammophila CBS 110553 TaxID=1182543 RepID=W9WWK9_9EURO|nr:murein transglycosylase [Cladophialophora psammophila CBS 110553]EXJ69420.1 murein transglycosylase [Cladophialophora psammophila CBS 110553]
MRFSSIALTAVAATATVAQPHVHKHRRMHEHKERDVTETAWTAGPTAYVYMLNGKELSAGEVCDGLEGHELKFVDGQDPGVCSQVSTSTWSSASSTSTESSAAPSTTTWSAPASSSAPAEFFQKPSSSDWSSPSESASSSSAPTQSSSVSSGGTGINAPFPDGQLDCSTFPSQYGAISLDYLGMGGWSGLQAVTIAGGFVNHIVTGVSGETCTEGMMCSYACPPGYQKSQWPSTQGATGQSVGGLSCSGGKLHLTNPGLSNNLCIAGVGGVQATNNAGGVVAICRTDYPGTESETIPVELQPGETEQLTVPDAASYYEWQGQSTSAQYYLNPIGVSAAQGCQWGSPGQNIGNYAPINFGVGAKGGVTWLSIFQNSPTTSTQYQGTVELKGNLSGSCKYSNGQYCGASGCNSQGCTVS